MNIELGVKSDPIEYRYSFEWLFELMARSRVSKLQLGSFFELYDLPDDWFSDLRKKAEDWGIRISSVFTAHRELGGFFAGDARMEKVARANYARLIQVAALLGADFAGSNPGAVFRDRMDSKAEGLRCYVRNMKELSCLARELGLSALTVEAMSCLAEPPTRPSEIVAMMEELNGWHASRPGETVPVLLCADISHGYADETGRVVETNEELFAAGLPWTCEFHIKNTDAMFSSTFGFAESDRERGVVDARRLFALLRDNEGLLPVRDIVGYLEIGGPKLGRDYSDFRLGRQLEEALEWLKAAMDEEGRPS